MSPNEIEGKDGKKYRDPIKIDDASNLEKLKAISDNQRYWTNRWADQMNYRYWKERCLAEQTDEAVRARELFYQGTIAYKTGDFPRPPRSTGKGSRSGRGARTTTRPTATTTSARRRRG